MGLIEAVFQTISLKSLAYLIFGGIFLKYVISRIIEHVKIKRLGGYGFRVTSYVPFGLDLVVRIVRAAMKNDMMRYWRWNYTRMGTCFTTEGRVFNQRIIFTAEPENVKAILATQFSDFGKGAQFHDEWHDFLGDSIFTTDGQQWHDSRQLIRPQFTRDRVSDLHCFESHMKTLMRAIDNGGALNGDSQKVVTGSGSGKVIDISDLFFRYTLDVTTDFLLGKDTKSLTSPQNDFADAFNEVQHIQNIIARTSKLRPLIPKAKFWRGLTTMNSFINFYIDRALSLTPAELASQNENKDKSYNFLHAIAGYTRDRKLLRDQIVAVLLAGRDTTASTLSWAIYELARHPSAVKKLRQEILTTVGKDKTPTYEHLKNMPYLKAVLNETLRLYPSVPYNVRITLTDTTLPRGGGPDGSQPLAVLKDTPIAYSTLVMQRRSDLYPPVSDTFAHPEVFSPERWSVWHPRPHDYIPFNAGPRICIGQQFALTEMGYVLCRLFQRFERVEGYMYEIDGGQPDLKSDVILSPGQGVKVAFYDAKH